MEYVKVFDTYVEYDAFKASMVRPNISFVKEDRGLYFNPAPNPRDFAGSICLWDNVNNKKVFCLQEELSVEKYPSSQYTPIGVVVIPSSHDVYGTGECGIMSLKAMNYSTPDNGGTSEKGIYWGDRYTDISLSNLTQVPLISSALTSNEITGVKDYGYLPSTNINGNFILILLAPTNLIISISLFLDIIVILIVFVIISSITPSYFIINRN